MALGMDKLLTAKQYKIVALLATGKSPQEIADTFSISVGTVRNHILHVTRLLRCSNVATLSLKYFKHKNPKLTILDGAIDDEYLQKDDVGLVIFCAFKGSTVKQIGTEMGRAPGFAVGVFNNVKKRLGARTKQEALFLWLKNQNPNLKY